MNPSEGTDDPQPEGMLNINAGLIMLTCFIFAFTLSGMMRATTSMVVGTLFAICRRCLRSGWSTAFGWVDP